MYQKEPEMKGAESGSIGFYFQKTAALVTEQKAGGVQALALGPSPHQSLAAAAHRDSNSLSPHLRN